MKFVMQLAPSPSYPSHYQGTHYAKSDPDVLARLSYPLSGYI